MKRIGGLRLVEQKIADFHKNEPHYLSKAFQETETRNRFIDPLFQALGWDFEQTHLPRDEWDVHREFSQKERDTIKKPDYAFCVIRKCHAFTEMGDCPPFPRKILKAKTLDDIFGLPD